MEILFISYKYPPEPGGMQKQSYELITGVSKLCTVHKIVKSPKQSALFFFISLLWRFPIILVQNPKIQLIHLNDGTLGLFAVWIKLITRIPVALTYHGLDLVHPSSVYQKYLLKLVRLLDGFICVSEFTARECLKRGFDASKVFVIPNGVDPASEYDLNEVSTEILVLLAGLKDRKKKVLISIGRPVRRKGFSWFVKNVLAELDTSYHHVIIGTYTPPAFKGLTKIVPRSIQHKLNLFLGLPDDAKHLIQLQASAYGERFTWLQKCNYASLLFLLQQSDLFVMPNLRIHGDAEGFGLVALESVIHGTPVLAAEIDGITSAIHDGRNGTFVPSENSEEWKLAIQHHFNVSESSKQSAIKAAQIYTKEKFTWKRMCQSYHSKFERIIASCNTTTDQIYKLK